MLLSGWALSALSLALSAPAPVDSGTHFECKFATDKPFYVKMVTETAQKMKVGGNDIAQTQKQTFLFRWAPMKQLPDRSWVVKKKLEAIQMDIDIAGSKITYDSARPGNGPLDDLFKAMLGAEFTLTISPRKKVTRVEGREALLAKLGNGNALVKALLEETMSESALKAMAGPLLGALPERAVKKGARWASEGQVPLGSIGTYVSSSQHLFEGLEQRGAVAKIAVKTKLTFQPPAAGGGGGALPFKIKSAKLASSAGGGTVYFNIAKGRVERSEMTARLAGKMTIEVGGVDNDIELDQTQKTTVTTSDERPS
jgi:hypothetical protein